MRVSLRGVVAAGVAAGALAACAEDGLDPGQRLARATLARAEAACACEGGDDGCVSARAGTARERACDVDAYRAVEGTLGPAFDCRARAEADAAACLAASGCLAAGVTACEEARLAASAACPTPGAEDLRDRERADFACLGAPGCPARRATGTGAPLLTGVIDAHTRDDHEATCASVGGRDVSILWTAPAPGRYRVDTEGSTYDSVIATFESCTAPEPLGCDDDDSDLAGRLFLDVATAGEPHLLVVDAFDADQLGTWALRIQPVE